MIDIFKIGIGKYTRDSDITDDEWSFLKKVEYENNFNNSFSSNMNLFEFEEMKSIHDFCQDCVNSYHNHESKYTSRLKIISSWINKNDPGQSHHMHKHQNSILTGVFYLQDTTNIPITFYNPILQTSAFYEEPKEYNQYNVYSTSLSFLKNTCIIFPSYLFHSVVKNNTDSVRYSIAFNTFYEKNQIIGNKTALLEF